eukprot:1836167-Lingulodinium_polyedra.AAC.1
MPRLLCDSNASSVGKASKNFSAKPSRKQLGARKMSPTAANVGSSNRWNKRYGKPAWRRATSISTPAAAMASIAEAMDQSTWERNAIGHKTVIHATRRGW